MRVGWWPWAGGGRDDDDDDDDSGGIFGACVCVRVVVMVCTLVEGADERLRGHEKVMLRLLGCVGAIAWWNGRPGPGRENLGGSKQARALHGRDNKQNE